MKNFVCVLLAFTLVLGVAPSLFAQCNSANGQCGAPNGLQAQAVNSLAFLQQQSAATSASSSVAAPAAPAVVQTAPAYAYPQYQMYAYPGVAAQATVVHPSQLMFALPPVNPTQPAGVAVAPPAIPMQPSYYSLIGLQTAAPAAASGASAAASAAAAPVAVAPIAVNPGLAQSSSSCANGSCSARRGLFPILGRRSSSRSVSISRSRVR